MTQCDCGFFEGTRGECVCNKRYASDNTEKKMIQCGSCEEISDSPDENNECPKCHSGNWVYGYIDDYEGE
jgi:Zn finger protein HypA/HybF involved in hydrogenase expression